MVKRTYVNVYDYGRAYGGPEEGGWWFDVLDPIKSIRCLIPADAEKLAEKLREEYAPTGRASSVLGGEDYQVIIEDHPAEAYPETRPHYE